MTDHDDSLAPFIASARRTLDDQAARRPRPPVTFPQPSGWARPVAVAAMVVLGIGTAGYLAVRASVLQSRVEAEPLVQAQSELTGDDAAPKMTRRVAPHAEDQAVVVPDPEAPAEQPVADRVEPQPATSHRPAEARTPALPPESLEERLTRLDARAQAQWAAGNLRGAERTFSEIVRIGGRTRHAELAYGDLFTLARQAGDTKRQDHLWARYLAKFPKGRFADEARAWQCRRTRASDADACWRGYLDDWPEGAHVREATRAMGSGAAP